MYVPWICNASSTTASRSKTPVGACKWEHGVIPLALSSSVQRLIRSWTSSGSTVVRVHASSQRGFWGFWLASWSRWPCFLDLILFGPSLPLRRAKKPTMVGIGGGVFLDEKAQLGRLRHSTIWNSKGWKEMWLVCCLSRGGNEEKRLLATKAMVRGREKRGGGKKEDFGNRESKCLRRNG